LGTPPYDMD